MPEPTVISPNSGAIYSADLLYEQNCKCGTTEVFVAEESFNYATNGDKGWKMVALEDGSTLEGLVATNIVAADCVKLISFTYEAGQEILAQIESFDCMGGGWIVYKDCKLS